VAHPSYVKRAGKPKTPADLRNHATLVYSLGASGLRWDFSLGQRRETVRVNPLLQANSSLVLQQAVLGGLGIARIPSFIVGADLAARRLVHVLPEWGLADQGIFALLPAREHVPRKTRAFVDFFRERLGDPPYWDRPK
jgi:DNA-binding transcriptional LysR family regulator